MLTINGGKGKFVSGLGGAPGMKVLILGGGVGALVYILGPLAAWLMLRRSWSLLR